MDKLLKSALGVLTILWVIAVASEAQDIQVQETVQQFRSGETRLTVECFAPAVEGKFPAIVLLHGSGGLELGTGDLFRAFARDLSSEGFVVLIPHLFEKTSHVVGKPFGDKELLAFTESVHDAIDFAVASGAVDPEKIGLVGWSLGSHLAFSQSSKDPRIRAIASISGYLPVESKSKMPPVLIVQGSKDKTLPSQRLRDFQAKMKADESPVETRIYKGVGHNLDLPTWEDVSRRTAVFMNKYLKRHAPRKSKAR
jgi:dienelactone hydrolase